MSEFKPTKIDLSKINGGKGKYNNGDGVQADTINSVIEASAWAQALGTNQPNTENVGNVGTPTVSIETMSDGTPRLKFENLKGEKGADGKDYTEEFNYLLDGLMYVESRVEATDEHLYKTDKNVKENSNKLKAVENALIKSGTIDKTDGALTEEVQQTGGADLSGLSILDNSYATVNKISGNTVKCENLVDISQMVNNQFTITSGVAKIEKTSSDRFSNKCFFDTPLPIGNYTVSVVIKKFNLTLLAGNYNGLCFQLLTNDDKQVGLGIFGTFSEINQTSIIKVTTTAVAHKIRIYVDGNCQVGDYIEFTDFMLNAGETALPYQPYFTGLKNAQISDIKSTGRNLFNNSDKFVGISAADADILIQSSSWTTFYIAVPQNTDMVITGIDTSVYIALGNSLEVGASIVRPYNSISAGKSRKIQTQNYKYLFLSRWNATLGSIPDDEVKIMVNLGTTEIPYESYTESVMSLPETVELGKWDYIENGKIVRETSELLTLNGSESWIIVNDSSNNFSYFALSVGDFNSVVNDQIICDKIEQVYISVSNSNTGINITNSNANNDARITFRPLDATITTLSQLEDYLSSNPLTIAYQLATPTYEPITFNNQYLVWDKGIEQVLTTTDNDGYTPFDYGANTTEENNYYVIVGGNE